MYLKMHFSVEIMFENVIWYLDHSAKSLFCMRIYLSLCLHLSLSLFRYFFCI